MRATISILIIGAVFAVAGCTSPEKREAHARADRAQVQTEIEQEKRAIMRAYRECLERSKKSAAEDCDRYQKAVESLGQ